MTISTHFGVVDGSSFMVSLPYSFLTVLLPSTVAWSPLKTSLNWTLLSFVRSWPLNCRLAGAQVPCSPSTSFLTASLASSAARRPVVNNTRSRLVFMSSGLHNQALDARPSQEAYHVL